MATVGTINHLRIVIYSNDHRPAHVHVIGPDHEAVFDLRCPDGPVSLRENFGFANRQLTKIGEELTRTLLRLCSEWRRIHGPD